MSYCVSNITLMFTTHNSDIRRRLNQLTYAISNNENILKEGLVQAMERISLKEVRKNCDYILNQLEKYVKNDGGGVFI
ncbi:hypothetical protein ABEB36_008293 [Hypothenemus hampei]|uniref:Uncharacterized protein n=1 Tax=Hypothenemus hampei TaxID=57062 RepID=A0ABD1ENL0_HYPHA